MGRCAGKGLERRRKGEGKDREGEGEEEVKVILEHKDCLLGPRGVYSRVFTS